MRALLAEGTDVDQRAQGGQTALMLAAIFGHVEIARLLLAAGADVQLQDDLGLTAREWADRRGSSEVAQIISNASTAEIVPSPGNAPAKQARPKVEAERRSPATEAKPTPQPDALSATKEQQTTKADPAGTPSGAAPLGWLERREAEPERRASGTETRIAPQHDELRWIQGQLRIIADQERRKAEEATRRAPAAETKLGSQQDAPSVADEQQRTQPEPEARKAEEARPTATESVRIAARIEHLRILEESRQRVEAEARAKSQRATRQKGSPAERSTQPAMLEPKASQSLNPPPIKRCPKCNTTYEDALIGYCSYDATRLISADDLLFNSSAANDWARPTVWALVAIMVVVGASIGFLINDYLSRGDGSNAFISAEMEQPGNARKDLSVNVRKDLPVIGGALSGMEVNVPEPEYPAKAKTEGVSGTVTVQVQVNKKGRVISARSSSGDWRLRAAAVKAAQKATFSEEKLAGRRAIGSITYAFRL